MLAAHRPDEVSIENVWSSPRFVGTGLSSMFEFVQDNAESTAISGVLILADVSFVRKYISILEDRRQRPGCLI